MSELNAEVSRAANLLTHLYDAAAVLLQAVADPIILDEAPLNHRVQALDAIARFIDRIEKREAAASQAESAHQGYDNDNTFLVFTHDESTQEDIDCHVALELEHPNSFNKIEEVVDRIAYLEQHDPEALKRFDPRIARRFFRDGIPGTFTNHVWPEGEPGAPTTDGSHFSADRAYLRNQIAPLPPRPDHTSPFA